MKTVDLFAGCGGLSLGFQNAGHEILVACELSPAAVDCYNQNFNTHEAVQIDLSNTAAAIRVLRRYGKPDIIVGGPPCQDFSSAGQRKEGRRAALTRSFAEIVCNIKPKYFVMENVARARHSETYASARSLFRKTGYGLTELVLDASYYGVPQRRKRFVCVGCINSKNHFLDEVLLTEASIVPMSVKDKYKDFPLEVYYRHPRSYKRRAIFSVNEPAPTIRGVNRPMPSTYVPHKNDAGINGSCRALTYKERAMLQTFPDEYNWKGFSNAQIEQMIGNAVPIALGEKIARSISFIDASNGNDQLSCMSFPTWLRQRYSKSKSLDILKTLKTQVRSYMDIANNKYKSSDELSHRITIESINDICAVLQIYVEYLEDPTFVLKNRLIG